MNETAIRDALAGAVAGGQVAGAVVGVTDKDASLIEIAVGRQSIDAPDEMRIDSVCWIASMTKAITTVAALQLVEQGKLRLDGPIGELLPDLAAPMVLKGFNGDGVPILRPAETQLTLRHLLTHTSGFSYEFANGELARYLTQTGTPGAATGLKAGLPLINISRPILQVPLACGTRISCRRRSSVRAAWPCISAGPMAG
jgi:CubicO group peptidase (beta-lactamase class C family)